MRKLGIAAALCLTLPTAARAADNWGQVAKLTASDGAADDQFGASVSVNGDTVVVGARWDDDSGSGSGSAYVFVRSGSLWSEQAKLMASDGAALDYFGFSVFVSGDTAVVGAYGDADNGDDSGSAYVFQRDQGGADNWGQVKKLLASDGAADDQFGASVSVNGDTVVVGAIWDDDLGMMSGSAYVFDRDEGGTDNWGQVKKLLASDGAADDLFGYPASISGDTVAIGAAGDGSFQGSVYVFQRDEGGADNWGQVKKLLASDGAADDLFGRSVSVSGDSIVVGADGDDDNQGSGYVFQRDEGGADNWGQVKKLLPSDGAAGAYFGRSVSVDADTTVIGAPYGGGDLSAYVFDRNSGGADNWGEVKKLTASDGAASDWFGYSVSVDGDTILVGAYGDDEGSETDCGSAYVFKRRTVTPFGGGCGPGGGLAFLVFIPYVALRRRRRG